MDIRDKLIKQTKRTHICVITDKWVTRLTNLIIILALIFILSALYDALRFSARGAEGLVYHDFDELLKINPDTVAWIKMDGTNIDHPVVQGKDNFEYLDKDFYGNFYAGGTLFLDCDNNKEFKDDFNIIHGHHMAMGAMFGDLYKYLDSAFINKNNTGILLTPTKNYRLEVFASGTADAYDDRLYNVKLPRSMHIGAIRKIKTETIDENFEDNKILVLSTCTGDMNNNRTVVFCKMIRDKSLDY